MVFSPSFTRFVHTKLIYLSPSSSFSIGAENCKVSKNLRSCVISTHPKKKKQKIQPRNYMKREKEEPEICPSKASFFCNRTNIERKAWKRTWTTATTAAAFSTPRSNQQRLLSTEPQFISRFLFFYLSNKMQLRQRRAYPCKQALCSTPNGHSLHGLSRDARSPRAWTARYKYDQYKNNYFSQLALPRYETSFLREFIKKLPA